MQRLTLQVEQFAQLLVATVGVLQAFRQAALSALDDPFLLAQIVRLLFHRLLSFVEQAFAISQFVANLAEFLLGLGFLLKRPLFDLQFGFPATVCRFPIGPLQNRSGLRSRRPSSATDPGT